MYRMEKLLELKVRPLTLLRKDGELGSFSLGALAAVWVGKLPFRA